MPLRVSCSGPLLRLACLGGGGPVPVPPYLTWGCGGGGRASPGGLPSTVARGVWGHALPLPRLPAHWVGCRGPRSTCCGRGRAGVGALLCPLGRHALWGLRAAGRVRGVHVLGGGLGGGLVGLGWVKASPGRLPTVRAAFPAGPDRAAVPGCPVTRPTGLLTAPRPRGGARGREMPPCLCVCALVCLWRGGGGLWHTCLLYCCSALAHMVRGSVCLVLQAPAGRLESLTLSPPGEMWAWARNLHVTRTCYPTTPRLPVGTGRRWYVARLGSDPHSLTALGTGGAATRAGSGSPRPRAYRGQVEGHQGAKSASLPWVPPVLAALAAALQPA